MTCNEFVGQSANNEQDYEEYDESMMLENLPNEIEQLESQKKPNLEETELINLGDEETVEETRISIHLEDKEKQKLIELLKQYINIFSWSYDDMPGLSTEIISHKLPTDPNRPPVNRSQESSSPT